MVADYEWDNYIVDEAFAELAAREFADPKNGIPEWVKNSNDAYVRSGRQKEERCIITIYSTTTTDYKGPILACLDLVGMSSEDLSRFKRWGDTTSAGSNIGITGGHGNGGKSYAISGFKGPSIYYTLRNSIGNIYGFPEPPRPVPAWFPNGKNIIVNDPIAFFKNALSKIGITPSILPIQVQSLLPNLSGFTLVVGHQPKDITGKFLKSWTNILSNSKELITPLQNCEIYVLANGRLLNGGNPLSLQEIAPLDNYREPRIIVIPPELIDPESGKSVSMIGEGNLPQGELTLKTMEKRILQFHRIDYIQNSRIVGTRPVKDFVGQSYWFDHIFGSCTLPCLTEEYVGNLRGPLVDRPLSRALNNWIGDQIVAWSQEMEKASAKGRQLEVTEERKKRIFQQMLNLNKLKDRLLDEIAGEIGGEGEGGGGKRPRRPPIALPDLPVASIHIASEGEVAGRLVELPLTLNFYDGNKQEVKPVSIVWNSSVPSVARVNEARGVIVTEHEGTAEIWCVTENGIMSNKIPLRVVKCANIELNPSTFEIGIGRRIKIRAFGKLDTGEEVPDIRLFWKSDDTDIALVGQHGTVTGLTVGETNISAVEGNGIPQNALVKVVPQLGGGKGPTKPSFLLSEIQTAWYEKEPRRLTPDHTLIYQDAYDVEYNVWWVNLKSPIADYIYNKHGVDSEVWIVYLAERFADGLAEAAMLSGPERGQESVPITNVLYDVAEKKKEFVKRFIEEFYKDGQILLNE
ncbi:MAG: Ig-like domain-containing protein [Dehalococcoidales bacterium]|nr:Ig-like domain-containing protein [Dehalococcoidales bacterium]